MSDHRATVSWRNDGGDFPRRRYSRAHTWRFDGGVVVPASASPDIVAAPYARADAVDPEEAFVASIAACHMLWALALAAARKLDVAAYDDDAVGVMAKDADGREWIARVTLRPRMVFNGPPPDAASLAALHHEAHARCFIANSVKTEIVVEPG
ncbi:MAG: OsmC family protein [Rhodospirillaceae bacterium]|nr:OsmC family protein [Rhodospirillaceae bacterium]